MSYFKVYDKIITPINKLSTEELKSLNDKLYKALEFFIPNNSHLTHDYRIFFDIDGFKDCFFSSRA